MLHVRKKVKFCRTVLLEERAFRRSHRPKCGRDEVNCQIKSDFIEVKHLFSRILTVVTLQRRIGDFIQFVLFYTMCQQIKRVSIFYSCNSNRFWIVSQQDDMIL